MWYGHQSFAFENFNSANCAGSKRTVFVSLAAIANGLLDGFSVNSSTSRTPVTCRARIVSQIGGNRHIGSRKSSFKWDLTNGLRIATGPLAVTETSFQIPRSLSAGAGFQSTHVMPRSSFAGAVIFQGDHIFRARPGVFRQIKFKKSGKFLRRVLRVGNFLPVKPHVRPVIDARKMNGDIFLRKPSGQYKFVSPPPTNI